MEEFKYGTYDVLLQMNLPRPSRQEDLSIAYILAVAATAGYDCGRPGSHDVGEDLEIITVLKKGRKVFKTGPNLYVQAKSSQNFEISEDGSYIKYDLEVDSYNKLIIIAVGGLLSFVFVAGWRCASE